MNRSEIYVIMAVDWMYNDEYYYTSENEGGRPKAYYLNKSDADAQCLKMNIEGKKDFSASDFAGYDDKEVDLNDIDLYKVVAVPLGQ